MRPKTVSCLFLMLPALACATSHEPRLVSVPQPGIRAAAHIDAIFDYRTAAATVAAVFERELGIKPFPVTFHFYPNRVAFEAGLLGVGYPPDLARSTARTMSAIGGSRRVLLNESALDGMTWMDRTALLAHELVHSLQYELGGGRRGASDQWLREGFADWIAGKVLERLGAASIADFRRYRQRELRATGRRNTPGLGEVVTFPQWVEVGGRNGPAAYALAFLAVDALIERHGIASIIGYFERFADSQDRLGHFRAAFGEDLDTFEEVFMERLWR